VSDPVPAADQAAPAPAPTTASGELPGKRFLVVNAIALAFGVVFFFVGLAMPPRQQPVAAASPSPAAVAGQK
jgi:hypothetical protein